MKCPRCNEQNPADAIFCGGCRQRLGDTLAFQETQLDGAATSDSGPSASARLQPGSVFADRYEIAAVIGEGGMGTVYRARDRIADTTVALKLVRPDRLAGADAVKRLVREGVNARNIRHPNVVAVYDVGETNGQPYISMEHLSGKSLGDWNRERMRADVDCRLRTAVRIVSEILDGLEAAHKLGVIHRDLKPDNVMLLGVPSDSAAPLKILDFGVARAPGADTGSTAVGTGIYMAPEQRTAPDAAQASADLYSLSVMFYELLIGVVPQGHWQPPSQGRADVPPAIDALIQRGLSNSPRTRPQSTAEYRAQLAAAMSPSAREQPQPAPRPQPKVEPVDPKPEPNDDGRRKRWPFNGKDDAGKSFYRRNALWIWLGGGLAAVSVIASAVDSDQGGGGFDPSPPPQGSAYAWMNGYWKDDFGNTWTVQVDPTGYVAGRASSGAMAGADMSGAVGSGGVQLNVVAGPQTAAIAGSINGCHIQYTVQGQWGAAEMKQFHINHQPGAPCPQ